MKEVFFLILSLLFFVRCNEQSPAEAQNETSRRISDNTIIETADSAYNEKPAAPPLVIRSALPAGFYGYDPDTTQVSQYIRRVVEIR